MARKTNRRAPSAEQSTHDKTSCESPYLNDVQGTPKCTKNKRPSLCQVLSCCIRRPTAVGLKKSCELEIKMSHFTTSKPNLSNAAAKCPEPAKTSTTIGRLPCLTEPSMARQEEGRDGTLVYRAFSTGTPRERPALAPRRADAVVRRLETSGTAEETSCRAGTWP